VGIPLRTLPRSEPLFGFGPGAPPVEGPVPCLGLPAHDEPGGGTEGREEVPMLGIERRVRLDEVRLAMERVRSGESDFEQIGLPSGHTVTIQRDESSPLGIRIQTPAGPGVIRRGPQEGFRRRRMLRRSGVAASWVQSRDPQRPEGSLVGGEAIRLAQDAAMPHALPVEPGQKGSVSRVRSFPPDEERPLKYPENIPFLPNVPVSISVERTKEGSERARNAAWMKPADPKGALEEIREQLRAGGWEEGETSYASTFMGHTRTWLFERDEVQRAVVLLDFGKVTQIMLFERVKG